MVEGSKWAKGASVGQPLIVRVVNEIGAGGEENLQRIKRDALFFSLALRQRFPQLNTRRMLFLFTPRYYPVLQSPFPPSKYRSPLSFTSLSVFHHPRTIKLKYWRRSVVKRRIWKSVCTWLNNFAIPIKLNLSGRIYRITCERSQWICIYEKQWKVKYTN